MKKLILPAILITHIFILYTLQFTAWPEMFSYPFLVNNGFKLYHDIIYPYPPLLVTTLAKIYLYFGYNILFLEIFTWALLITNDLLIFAIASKITKSKLQIYLSLIFYCLAQSILEGNMMWFDVAIVTPLLVALFLTISQQNLKNKYLNKSYLMLIGLMLSLSIFIKQTTGIFLIFYFAYFIYKKAKYIEIINFLFAPIFMGTLFILKLIGKQRLLEALNWMLVYPFKYWSKIPGYVQFNLNKNQILILIFLLIPSIYALYKLKIKSFKILLTSYLLISLFIIYPRFSFFHFQLGIAVAAITISYLKPKYILILLATFMLTIFIPKYKILATGNTRFWGEYETNLAADIDNRVNTNQTIYLFNIHSGIYSLANRLPPKPWFDNFAWYLEIPDVQQQILTRWQENPPDYIYLQIPEPGDWYELGTYMPKSITDWLYKNYTLIDTYGDNIQIYKYENSIS